MRYLVYVYPILSFIAIILVYMAITVNPVIIVAPALLVILMTVLKRIERKYLDRKLLESLNENWGKGHCTDDEKLAFDGWRKYYQTPIDDITSSDLNLKMLFAKMNNAITVPGVHLLYHLLHQPEDFDKINERKEMIQKFQNDLDYRKRVQKRLIDLGKNLGEGVSKLLHEELTAPIASQWRYILQVLALPIALGIAFFQPVLGLIMVMLSLIYNVNTYFKLKRQISIYSNAFIYVRSIIVTAKQLIDDKVITDPDVIKAYADSKPFANGLVFSSSSSMSLELSLVYDYLNIVFLIDPIRFNNTLHRFKRDLTCLKTLYYAIGEIDATMCMANYQESLEHSCTPAFVDTKRTLVMHDGFNPLVAKCVSNSVTLENDGALITGSNMSGKSTFLRTVGLNVLMAQTCTFAPSRSLSLSKMHVISSISLQDNIEIGDSYYLSEAKAIKRMIEALDDHSTSLLLIDEIFNGTNRRERVAAAEAILKHFKTKSCIPFVATHDLEITDKIDSGYQKFYFKESVQDDDIHFNYHLNVGVTTTHNALEILRLIGYPSTIYEESKRYANE